MKKLFFFTFFFLSIYKSDGPMWLWWLLHIMPHDPYSKVNKIVIFFILDNEELNWLKLVILRRKISN